MSLSPKKHVSQFTSSTTDRGVSAKEIEIHGNTRLDMPPAPPDDAPAEPDGDDSNSYIQVEVRRARRVPVSSSPAPPAARTAPPPTMESGRTRAAGGAGEGVLTVPLLSYPASTPPVCCVNRGNTGGAEGDGCCSAEGRAKKNQGVSLWRKMSGYVDGGDYDVECGGCGPPHAPHPPQRVEVYYFERGCGAWLSTSDAAPQTHVERWAGFAGGQGGALLAEALAVPRVALEGAVGALVGTERALLVVGRAAAVGALQTAADYALKPALTLTFNALVHPPLVFLGNVLRALRDALQPLWAALGDALEPLRRLLAAPALVHLHIDTTPAPAPTGCTRCPHCAHP